jgi:polyisoprenoid-binding protein YceI
MKKSTILLVVIGLTFASFKAVETITYKAVVAESEITWSGSRPGKTHDGTLAISDGNFVFEDGKLASGSFTLNMTTIKVADIKPGKMNDKLVTHFNSADFFDVTNHPKGSFLITGSEVKDGKTIVTGKLTIKGITNDVSFSADVSTKDDTVVLKSDEFKIDRTKWDIKFRSGSYFDGLKNKLIYDDITITVKVTAKK